SPRASLRRRHGVRDARTQSRSEYLSLEATQGTDSPGGAADPFVPEGASPRLNAARRAVSDLSAPFLSFGPHKLRSSLSCLLFPNNNRDASRRVRTSL